MQPYFLPYIGYFQLINAVDTFVLLDDVNFIKRGWINRNNILLNKQAHMISIPIDKPSQNKLINETKINFTDKNKEKLIKTIHMAYSKAPMFDEVYPIIENIINNKETDLTNFLLNSFIQLSNYLGIKTEFLLSSQINKDNSLKSQYRIIEICEKLNTKTYINLPGGKSLYDKESFLKEKIELRFIMPNIDNVVYKQFNNDFIENLSFLDIIMFNDRKKALSFLQEYSLSE